ncbi:sugar ABC transporter permease [Mesorhizobium sp. KR9-304]|uniref:carbohydrate ABC transporter permease n=1 Tax=Mesorhizobium sp. KR9-304 TaxID=3156614 RepID=UPI0032B5FADB
MPGEKIYRAPLHRRLRPLFFLSPTLIILLSITFFPLLYSLYLASHTVILTNPMLEGWSLQDNLREVFLESPEYWDSFVTTLILVISVVAIEFVLGLMLAYFFFNSFRGRDLLFPFFLMPMMLTPVVVGTIWRFLFNGEFGLIAGLLKALGVVNYSILNEPSTALIGVVIADVWQWTPFMLLLLLAGMRALPQSPFEAAQVDGANSFQIFRDIMLPMMKPIIVIALLIRTIDAFNRMFDIIYIMTNGGPGRVTETLAVMAFRSSFEYFFMHQGAIIALSMLVLITIMTKLLSRFMNVQKGD